MKYQNKPALQDQLAAEYVLGTLRGQARVRFQAWLRDDARLRQSVADWESRLAPMAAGVAPIKPPRRVWAAIDRRISERAPAKHRLWENVVWWRAWGLIATGCAAALVVALAVRSTEPAETPVFATAGKPAIGTQHAYVAVLHAQQDPQQLAFVAYVNRRSDELWVKRLALAPAPSHHAYELWGLPTKQGDPPVSLGMLPQDQEGILKLPGVADETLKHHTALAISVERSDGSASGFPTGPVIASGKCLRFW